MPQNIDRHLFGSSTAPRGVRIISVIFSLFSVAALVIFVVSIWRNIEGPSLTIKIVRLGLPIIVLAGAYMVRRLWHSGLWVFGIGVVLWLLVFSRALLLTNPNKPSFILVGLLWCFSLGTLIYLITVRKAFVSSVFLPSVPQNILPIETAETHPAPLPTSSLDTTRKEGSSETPPRVL